ncbi:MULTISPECIES: glycosyltransferase family 2 protein [Parabacteroides]|uniref:glycosyltransferase family 2 protein n=1 Tax=Parabacteroides leei TaxID=2939491 RepID=UPI0018999A3D|nr:glycosyltransferase family 2 protein [Parabacteroides goldsteinii]
MTNSNVAFSVIMPTYNNSSFIRRAIKSLIDQSYEQWELIIIDDGSTDDTFENIEDLLADKRITYHKSPQNEGLGVAINIGLDISQYDYIAYLPADDYYFKEHLSTFAAKFAEIPDAVLVFSGIQYDQYDSLNRANDICSNFVRPDYPLQLVQTAHKKNEDRWLTREEYVTDDLFLMYWHNLLEKGLFIPTHQITCYWTQHPMQRHKIVGERYGGSLNRYRSYYKVQTPIRMRVSKYKFVDEVKTYKNFRVEYPKSNQGLKILLVGELGYNPERICVLERAGHKLFGLWLDEPRYPFSNVGHLPFGHVIDIPYNNEWKVNVSKIKPDIIYALGNWDIINLAHDVLFANLGVPFVWHFKESPFLSMELNMWNKLIDLYKYSDGSIFINEQIHSWYELYCKSIKNYIVLDLDMPIADYFNDNYSRKMSDNDNEIHTLVAGRLIGISVDDMMLLADQNIHVHLYLENSHDMINSKYDAYLNRAPNHFHIHNHVSNNRWVDEFSQYNAGWLHCFDSNNRGNLARATWYDLNIPARIYSLMAAGLPMIQKDNSKHIVAIQELVRKYNIGICYSDIAKVGEYLHNNELMSSLNMNVLKFRNLFTFDFNTSNLIDFFYKTINNVR